MQDIVIGAFRKRLSNRGYTNISIKRVHYPYSSSIKYLVSAIEPLAHQLVSVECTIEAMYLMFR